MATKFIDAYNKITGDKLPHQVPESYLTLFKDTLRKTPSAAAAEKAADTKKETK